MERRYSCGEAGGIMGEGGEGGCTFARELVPAMTYCTKSPIQNQNNLLENPPNHSTCPPKRTAEKKLWFAKALKNCPQWVNGCEKFVIKDIAFFFSFCFSIMLTAMLPFFSCW